MTDAGNANGGQPKDHPDDVLALAEAEAEEAEAVAAAARARARAIRLRRQADHEDSEGSKDGETDPTLEDDEPPPTPKRLSPRRLRRPRLSRPRLSRLRRPSRSALLAGVAMVAIVGLLATSGFFLWHHRSVSDRQRRADEFTAAARSSVLTFMSLDFNHAKESVQRVIDNSTGEFKDQFQKSADALIKTLQEGKVITETNVNAAALKEMTDNSAVVLVAATTTVSNTLSATQPPRKWRLSVTITRDGGRLKMSKIDFGLGL